MTRPYSMDLRERAVARVSAGESVRSVAAKLSVSASSVVRWSQRQRRTGSAAPGRSAATIFWGLAAVASAALVWGAVGLEIDVRAIAPERVAEAPPAPDAASAPSRPVVPRPLSTYAETLDRPLFEASRRPPPETSEPDAKSASTGADSGRAPPEELRIVGIMRPRQGAAGARVLVRSSEAPQAIWVETGSSIAGWTVSAIGDRTITVEGGGERREISLFQSPQSSAN